MSIVVDSVTLQLPKCAYKCRGELCGCRGTLDRESIQCHCETSVTLVVRLSVYVS